jgi:hypothetical protein
LVDGHSVIGAFSEGIFELAEAAITFIEAFVDRTELVPNRR